MKVLVCKCSHCREVKRKKGKKGRSSTIFRQKISSGRSRAKVILKTEPTSIIDDVLPQSVYLGYYG